jgi:hypothetical protein
MVLDEGKAMPDDIPKHMHPIKVWIDRLLTPREKTGC